jgi:hypothetical protein
VDGYEQAAETLEPFGGTSSGSATMLDLATGEPVLPRWHTRCGQDASEAVLAIENQARFISRCAPLEDSTPTATSIRFSPEELFGPDPCLTVSVWSVYPAEPTLPASGPLDCHGAPLDYEDGVEVGSGYSFYVLAQRGRVPEGTECFAVARSGVRVRPTCGAWLREGYVELALDGLSVDGAPFCEPGARFDLLLGEERLNSEPLACAQPIRVGPFEPGSYGFTAALVDASGAPTGRSAECAAAVDPGRTVAATCALP